MAVYTESYGFYKNSVGFGSNYTNRLSVMEIDLDFAKIVAARAAVGATVIVAGDQLAIATLPKGAYVIGAAVTLLRAEGGVATIDVGVSGSLTLWASNFDVNGTVGTTSALTTGARYLTADTDVLLTFDNSLTDAARVKVALMVVNMGADQGTIPSA